MSRKRGIISMGRRKSQQMFTAPHGRSGIDRRRGTLFIVGNSLGSPEDLSIRAVSILKSVPIVAAETPLNAQELLAYHEIHTTITSYNPRIAHEKIPVLLHHLQQGGDIALLSDNGLPVIYDPGHLLIRAVQQAGYPVKIVPGPSALTAAIALSGSTGDRFVFEGRLPRTRHRLDEFFKRFRNATHTVVFYIDHAVLPQVVKSLIRKLPDRPITLAVNLTKETEQIFQGTPAELMKLVRTFTHKDDITVVLGTRHQRKKKQK